MSRQIRFDLLQTWKTKDIPEKWQPGQAAIRKHMARYQHFIYTDDEMRDYISDHYPQYLEFYDGLAYHIQRVDFFRYAWMARDSGVYMDLDYAPEESIDPYLEHGDLILMRSSNSRSYLTNSFMASRPGHPIWLEIMEEATQPLPTWVIGQHLTVMWQTGPGLLDRVVKNSNYPYVTLPNRFNPYSICDNGMGKSAVLRSLEGQSWVGWDTILMGSCKCNGLWWLVGLTIIIVLVLCLILFRVSRK